MASRKPTFGVKRPRPAATPQLDQAALAKMDAENAQAGGDSRPVEPTGTLMRRAQRGEKVTAYLPPELLTRLRVTCAHNPRRSISMALTEAAELWLAQHESGAT